MSLESYWRTSERRGASGFPRFERLRGASRVDVVIVGAGITGLTAALELKRAGVRVAVLERDRVGCGESGRSSAHVTPIPGLGLHEMLGRFGLQISRSLLDAGRAAMDRLERYCLELGAEADFKRVPGFLFASRAEGLERLDLEQEAGLSLDVPLQRLRAVPFPGLRSCWGALRFDSQARFDPIPYLHALAAAVEGEGCHVFERSRALKLEDGMVCRVWTSEGEIVAPRLLVAADAPMARKLAFQTKLAAYRTYVAVFRVDEADFPEDALFWDTEKPGHSLRVVRSESQNLLLVRGEDHKVGHCRDTRSPLARLEDYAWEQCSARSILSRWSGQILEPVDGLPYIGRYPGTRNTGVALGYSGNGTTWGTLGGWLLADWVLGRENPWAGILDARRSGIYDSWRAYLRENKDYPLCLAKAKLGIGHVRSVDEIEAGDGRVLTWQGRRVAVHRNGEDELVMVSAVCPHLGCEVSWNRAERTWDCPCHGSRFGASGELIHGPATADLEPLEPRRRKAA